MFRRVATAVWFLAFAGTLRAQSGECVGSVPVATFRLSAAPSGPGSPVWMPVRQINNLPAGYRLRYQPVATPAQMDEDAAVALLVVPKGGDAQMQVLEPGPATVTSNWTVPFDVSIVLLVFAPQGFEQKRFTNLVTRDPELISDLAEYADQTRDLEATLEATLEALRDLDDDTEVALEPGRTSTPTELALLALVRALNPAVSSYDPFGSGRRAGPTSMMGRGASLFFENAGGVVPGGGILPVAKQFLMPDSEFRSAFGAGAEAGSMTLCVQRRDRTRNKLAYVWAYRLNNAPAPSVDIAEEVADLPIGLLSSIPLKLETGVSWDLLARVTDWGLVPATGGVPLHVKITPSTTAHELRVDLRKFPGLPGNYTVEGRWDWGQVRLNGAVRVHLLDDLAGARIVPESQDRLVVNTGLVSLDLAGCNLRFIDDAWVHRPESQRRIRVDLPAKPSGAPDRMRVEVDTDGLHPGAYLLTLVRADGATTDIPVTVQAAPPVIESRSLRVNVGDSERAVQLVGSGLDRLEALESESASFVLGPPSANGTRRDVTVKLQPSANAGSAPRVFARIAGRVGLLEYPGLLQIAGARPRILASQSAVPVDLPVALRSGEVPAGSAVSFTVKVDAAAVSSLTVLCEGASQIAHPSFTVSEPGTLFFSIDPGSLGNNGCVLQAVVETTETGASDPAPLGTVVRVPRIEKFTVTNETTAGGYVGVLEGWDLETIERTGWTADAGLPCGELPRPIGQGTKQTLRIAVPWPSPLPKAPLFVFLRGESQGRATRVTP